MTEVQAENLLYVLPHPQFFSQTGGVGGHIAHARGILEALGRRGFELHVVHGGGAAPMDLASSRNYVVPAATDFLRVRWSLRLMRQLSWLVNEQQFAFAYMRYSVGFAAYFPWVKRILGDVPLILEVNSFKSQDNKWFIPLESRAFAVAHRLVAVSDPLCETIVARFGESIGEKTIVVPNGVDIRRFDRHMKSQSNDNSSQITLGYLGVFKQDYGLECLLDAMEIICAKNSWLRLVMIGAGPMEAYLKTRSVRLENVEIRERIAFDAVPEALAAFDILVYPTTLPFGSPTKLMEYMAAGRGIVAADTVPVRQLLGDDQRGLLYRMGDAKGLAEKVMQLADDPQLRLQLGEAAQREVGQYHTWDQRVEQILSFDGADG